jgi:hypothetical protein
MPLEAAHPRRHWRRAYRDESVMAVVCSEPGPEPPTRGRLPSGDRQEMAMTSATRLTAESPARATCEYSQRSRKSVQSTGWVAL